MKESFLIKAEDDLYLRSERKYSEAERIGENIEQVAINIIEDPSFRRNMTISL